MLLNVINDLASESLRSVLEMNINFVFLLFDAYDARGVESVSFEEPMTHTVRIFMHLWEM